MLLKKLRYENYYNSETHSLSVIVSRRYDKIYKLDMCSKCALEYIIKFKFSVVRAYKCRYLKQLPNYVPLDEVCAMSNMPNYIYIPESIT